MKDWHELDLIPLRRAVYEHPDISFKNVLKAVLSEALPLYYAIPPGRYAGEPPAPDKVFELIVDDYATPTLTVWNGGIGTEVTGPSALPISNAKRVLECAVYALITGGTIDSLSSAVDRRAITLRHGDRGLIPTRWPQAPIALGPSELSLQCLGDMFRRQHPDETEPLLYREIDDDPLATGDLLVPATQLAHLAVSESGNKQPKPEGDSPGATERKSFLNIIWAFRELAIKKSVNPNTNQRVIEDELVELANEYGRLPGVSRAKLAEIFAEANRLNEHRKRKT